MTIEIRPSGGAERAAATGKTIGLAEKAKREQVVSFQQATEQRAREWELEKMRLRSEQDFAQELRDRQYEYDRFNTAKQWDIEKMRLASEIDFQVREEARAKTIQESLNTYNTIKKKEEEGFLPPTTIDGMYLRWARRAEKEGINLDKALPILGKYEPSAYLTEEELRTAAKVSARLEAPAGQAGIFDLGRGAEGGVAFNPNDPLGVLAAGTRTAPEPNMATTQKLLGLERQNKFEVISPNGAVEIINATDWPNKKTQGYILGAIKQLRQEERPFFKNVPRGLYYAGH